MAQRLAAFFADGQLGAGIVVLTASAIGTGILALPYVLAQLGWVTGLGAIFALGILNMASLEALLEVGALLGCASYDGLFRQLGRPAVALLLDVTLLLDCLGAITTYLVFIGHLMPPLLAEFLGPLGLPPRWTEKAVLLPLLGLLATLAALPRRIGLLGSLSILVPCSMLYATALLAAHALTGESDHLAELPASRAAVWPPDKLQSSSSAIPVIMFSYICQFNVFNVYCDLSRPSPRDMKRLTRWSTAFQMTCYTFTAACGYAFFGGDVEDDFFLSFPAGSVWVDFGRLLVCLSLCIVVPLNVFPTRDAIVEVSSWIWAGRCCRGPPGAEAEGPAAPPACPRSPSSPLSGPSSPSASGSSLHEAASSPAPALGAQPSDALLVTGPCVAEDGPAAAHPPARDATRWEMHAGMAGVVMASTVALAFLVPSVSFLMGVVGGFCGVMQMYVLPGMALLDYKGVWGPRQRQLVLLGFAVAAVTGLVGTVSSLTVRTR